MPYYVRVLTPTSNSVGLKHIVNTCAEYNFQVRDDRTSTSWWSRPRDNWRNLEVCDASGDIHFTVEKIDRTTALLSEEIDEFMIEVANCAPLSAAQWLHDYLPTIETIYTFQILTPAIMEGQHSVFQAVMEAVREKVSGIIQADGEGFTNNDGFHILWQFSDIVSGDWWMAVLENGTWQEFKMNLGDPEHRTAFKSGKVPLGVERL